MLTPVFLKTDPNFTWPSQEKAFYLLTGEGLFFCRNHRFFKSAVPAPGWPAELAPHSPFCRMGYPRVPQQTFERIIGFFSRIGRDYGAEAAVLLAWNGVQEQYEIIVPDQQSVVGGLATGRPYPIEVHYQIPALPPDWLLVGDVHSHVDEAAYASVTDKQDEVHRPGLHIVVGRLYQEPPELHIEVTVDGFRFRVGDPSLILEGYAKRRTAEVPQDWLARVETYSWSEYNKRFGSSARNSPAAFKPLVAGPSAGQIAGGL